MHDLAVHAQHGRRRARRRGTALNYGVKVIGAALRHALRLRNGADDGGAVCLPESRHGRARKAEVWGWFNPPQLPRARRWWGSGGAP